MVLACYLSTKLTGFNQADCDQVKEVIDKTYEKIPFTTEIIADIIELLKFDKKNSFAV